MEALQLQLRDCNGKVDAPRGPTSVFFLWRVGTKEGVEEECLAGKQSKQARIETGKLAAKFRWESQQRSRR